MNIFKHYKNNKYYVIYDECHIQIDDKWIPAYCYKDLYKNKFVASQEEFKSKFTIISKEEYSEIDDCNELW